MFEVASSESTPWDGIAGLVQGCPDHCNDVAARYRIVVLCSPASRLLAVARTLSGFGLDAGSAQDGSGNYCLPLHSGVAAHSES